MDILGARETDSAVDTYRPGRPIRKESGPRWLQLALAIEEQQYECHLICYMITNIGVELTFGIGCADLDKILGKSVNVKSSAVDKN